MKQRSCDGRGRGHHSPKQPKRDRRKAPKRRDLKIGKRVSVRGGASGTISGFEGDGLRDIRVELDSGGTIVCVESDLE